MAFNAKDIIAKANQKTAEKEKKAEEERLAAIEAEKRRATQEAEEKARREKEAAELKRQKEEQERKEKEEHERKVLEEKMRIEAEKARVQEEIRQKAEEERRQKTAATSTEMDSMNNAMQSSLSSKNASSYEIDRQLKKAKELLTRDVDYNQISVYQSYKDNVSQMENRLQELRNKERKAGNRKENAKTAAGIIIFVLGITTYLSKYFLSIYQDYPALPWISLVLSIVLVALGTFLFCLSNNVDDLAKIIMVWTACICVGIGIGWFFGIKLRRINPEKAKEGVGVALGIVGAIVGLFGGIVGLIIGFIVGGLLGYFLGWVFTTVAGIVILIIICTGLACFGAYEIQDNLL